MSAITHVEFGIYLVAVGTEMRKQNLSLSHVGLLATDTQRQRMIQAMTSQGMSSGRAPIVFDSGWNLMAQVSGKTYPTRGEACRADEIGA